MIMTKVPQVSLPTLITEQASNHIGVGRLLAAAVVNHQFRELLLDNPQIALQNGYQGETFPLTSKEQDLIVSIRAKTLSEFASQIARALNR